MDCLGFLISAVTLAHVSCWISCRFPVVSVGFPSNSWRFLCRFPIVSDRVSSGLTRVSYGFLQVPSSFLRFPAGFFGVPSAACRFSYMGIRLILGVLLQSGFLRVSCGFLRVSLVPLRVSCSIRLFPSGLPPRPSPDNAT